MFFSCSSDDDDIVNEGCDTKQALKRLVHFPLEFIFRADDPKWQSEKSVSEVRGVEGGQILRLWTQLQLPVS